MSKRSKPDDRFSVDEITSLINDNCKNHRDYGVIILPVTSWSDIDGGTFTGCVEGIKNRNSTLTVFVCYRGEPKHYSLLCVSVDHKERTSGIYTFDSNRDVNHKEQFAKLTEIFLSTVGCPDYRRFTFPSNSQALAHQRNDNDNDVLTVYWATSMVSQWTFGNSNEEDLKLLEFIQGDCPSLVADGIDDQRREYHDLLCVVVTVVPPTVVDGAKQLRKESKKKN